MSYAHAIVWLDHQHATVIDFTVDDKHVEHVDAALRRKLHRKSGTPGSGRASDDAAFFDEVILALDGVLEVVVCGPGTAKVSFMHHLERRHPPLATKVVGVETLDHPSDGELLAYARRYFRRADALIGDS